MHADFRDLKAVFESHVIPGRAGIERTINSVAEGDRVARIGFASPHPNGFGVRVGHANRAHGTDPLGIELVLVGDAVVGGVQQAPGCSRNPLLAWVVRVDRHIRDATTHTGGAYRTPIQGIGPLKGDFALDLGGQPLTLGFGLILLSKNEGKEG